MMPLFNRSTITPLLQKDNPLNSITSSLSQQGRSMIEMLAVLAIIGVLSVAAVAGLMWAFAKYKANNTIHDVHLWELAALDSQQLYSMTSGELVLNELGEVSTHGYPMAIMVQDENVFYISVDDVPKRVCSLTLDMVEEPMIVTVNGVSYTGSDICDTDTNQMLFYYNKYMGDVDNSCIPACPSGETCCGGVCKQIETPCGSNGCLDCKSKYCTNSNTCCDNPNATKCGSNDCCEGNCCNGTCCPSGQVCGSDGNCACQNEMVLNPDTGLCECPEDKPYYFENEDMCCQSGYTPVDGVCQKIDCRGGPTNYNCYINDDQCGYNCDVLGRNCQYGICYADECLNDEIFTLAPETSYNCQYACSRNQDDGICYTYNRSEGYKCFSNNNMCMLMNPDLTQLMGICNSKICSNILSSSDFFYWGDRNIQCGACDFGDNLICYPTDNYTKWTCLKNGFQCGKDCQDPLNCGTCVNQDCFNNMIYNPQTKYCEDTTTGVYCSTEKEAYFQSCYQNGQRCERLTYNGIRQNGSCTPIDCPEGFEYGPVTQEYFGCSQKNVEKKIECYYDKAYAPTQCYYDGELCGYYCDYSGQNCGAVFLPQCALEGHCPQTGYDMSEGCTCDGSVTRYNGKDYCCPTSHEYVNGACALL